MILVLVEWVDSSFGSMWVHKGEEVHISKCCSVGILQRENDAEIELCLHITEETKAGCSAIPKSAITGIRKLHLRGE